jgi:hypothetical protein
VLPGRGHTSAPCLPVSPVPCSQFRIGLPNSPVPRFRAGLPVSVPRSPFSGGAPRFIRSPFSGGAPRFIRCPFPVFGRSSPFHPVSPVPCRAVPCRAVPCRRSRFWATLVFLLDICCWNYFCRTAEHILIFISILSKRKGGMLDGMRH